MEVTEVETLLVSYELLKSSFAPGDVKSLFTNIDIVEVSDLNVFEDEKGNI